MAYGGDDMTITRYLPLTLLVVLIAAGVRFHQIDAQSLWNDEGSSYVQATRSFSAIAVNAAADIHPPGYYWALKIWRGLVGDTAFALRMLSALTGTLTVAATIALGRRATPHHPMIAVIAGVWVALNTFQIYYSQEMRMYAALALWGTLSVWALLGFMVRPKWHSGVVLGVINGIGLWTQYAFPLVMLAQAALALMWLYPKARAGERLRALRAYVWANVLGLAIFAPLLPTALRQVTTWPNTGDSTPLTEGISLMLGWFALGITYHEVDTSWLAVMLILALFGLRQPTNHTPLAVPRRSAALLLMGVPAAIFLAAGLFREGNVKFLLPSQVGFALLVAQGVGGLWTLAVDRHRPRLVGLTRVTAAAALLAVSWTLIRALPPLYSHPAYQRNDYRAIVQAIDTHRDANTGVILNAPGQREVFSYYSDHPPLLIPRGINSTDDEIEADTLNAIGEHDALYLVLWGDAERDPRRIVETTLDTRAYEMGNTWYGDVRLVEYISPPPAFALTLEEPVQFGAAITLTEAAISHTTAPSGAGLAVRLTWTTAEALHERYVVFLQLLDDSGRVVAQRDAEPGGGTRLTTTWQPNTPIHDHHGLRLPAVTAEAHFTLIMGLYNPSELGERLLVDPSPHSDYLELSAIHSTPPEAD